MTREKPNPGAAFDLTGTYVHLEDGPAAVPVEAGDDFWASIENRPDLHAGRLALACHFRSADDWDHWERHPAGEELVVLLSGAMDMVLQEPAGERVVELRGRAACIVPRGVWHRGIVHAPSDALFVTRGAGTTHRPISDAPSDA